MYHANLADESQIKHKRILLFNLGLCFEQPWDDKLVLEGLQFLGVLESSGCNSAEANLCVGFLDPERELVDFDICQGS